MTRSAVVAAAAVLLLVVAPAATGDTSAPLVSYTVSGTAGANGWYTSNVTVYWSATDPEGLTSTSGCEIAVSVTVETPAGTKLTCTATSGGGTTTASVTIRIDKTAPAAPTAVAQRAPDVNGWYNQPVGVAFSSTDATSGIDACAAPVYGGPDSAGASVSGTCRDKAGNVSGPGAFALRYDATPPVVAAAAERAPDGRGWYRRPVTVAFSGTDATSGIGSCTEPRRYAGPDAASIALKGTCRDAAGNGAAETTFALRYDATAPKVGPAKATIERGNARVTWRRPPDASSIELERTPGVNGRKRTIVYRGRGEAFLDRTVRDGVRYRYEIRAADAAGNVGSRVVTAKPALPLYRPEAGAAVRAPVTLGWSPAAGARFYNVQLYRDGLKVLSAWPRRATLRLAPAWRYEGRMRRLEPGRYRWYVWPARGSKERPRYARLLGSSTFVVKAR